MACPTARTRLFESKTDAVIKTQDDSSMENVPSKQTHMLPRLRALTICDGSARKNDSAKPASFSLTPAPPPPAFILSSMLSSAPPRAVGLAESLPFFRDSVMAPAYLESSAASSAAGPGARGS